MMSVFGYHLYAALQLIRESRIFLRTVDICVHRVVSASSDTDSSASESDAR